MISIALVPKLLGQQKKMAHSGGSNARRPLPPLPYQDVSTGTEFMPPASSGDHGYAGTHMYHYIDKVEISKLRQSGKQRRHEEQPSGVRSDSLAVTVGQKVVGLVHNGTYAAGALRQVDSTVSLPTMSTTEKEPRQVTQALGGPNIARRPLPSLPSQDVTTGTEFTGPVCSGDQEDLGTHMYYYIDKDEISKLRQSCKQRKHEEQPSVVRSDSLPVTVGQKVVGLVNNGMYVAGALQQENVRASLPTMNTSEKKPRQMEQSEHNKARRPLPSLPSQDVTTDQKTKAEMFASTGSQHQPDTGDSHMYNHVDKDDIKNLRQPPADTATDDSIPKTTDSQDEPGTTDSHMYNYVDSDDINNLRQPPANTGTDSTAPKTTDRNIPGLMANQMYVPGALRQDTNDTANICGFSTRCKMAFYRSKVFIIIVIAAVVFLGTGAGIIVHLTATPGGQAGIHTPSVMANWTPSEPVTTTNVTATYPPIILTNAHSSATRPHLATSIFTPSIGTGTASEFMLITAAQTTSNDVVTTTKLPWVTTKLHQGTTTLPRVTTMLPRVTTEPPKTTSTPPLVTTTLPLVTSTLPRVITTLPQVTTTQPQMTTTLPQVTTTLPQVTTTLPQVTTTLPRVITTLPRVITTLPRVITTLPQVTATLPRVTATQPQEPTSPPKMTTTLQCSKLTPPEHGAVTRPNPYKDVAIFTCYPGYKLVGTSTLTCQSDGTWSGGSPTCTDIPCTGLTPPAHGAMTGSISDVVSFMCDTGYKLDGTSTLTCQSGGTWSGRFPTCSEECFEGKAAFFRGTVSVTKTGLKCQRWDSQTPHIHKRKPADYPSFGLEQNYCRDPDGTNGVWCYTTDPGKRWDYCDVPICNGKILKFKRK
ncbi:LPA [Branchiostoma lanceolatum]|uniref:LPA protein n=1 Tax=Branchiostoma lanceolatum TaxID=7740 RepID=A0A8S4ML93_BRALA|nr:LPA [Branchiostoma lanceolatum]